MFVLLLISLCSGVTSQFVAVTTSDASSSADGVTWTAIPTCCNMSCGQFFVMYGQSKFVAVGCYGVGSYSTDLATWTQFDEMHFGSNDVLSVAYGGSKFVAVGSGGRGSYSMDGVTWTAIDDMQFGSSGYSIESVTYGGSKFVAAGYGGRGSYSMDGVTWTAIGDMQFGRHGTIHSVTYGGLKFVAVGYTSGNNTGSYSMDGVTWTAIGDMQIGNSHYDIFSVTYGASKFVAVGSGGRGSYSMDGVTWTAIDDMQRQYGDSYSVTYGASKFVAVGESGRGSYSMDGVTWTAIDDMQMPSSNNMVRCVTYPPPPPPPAFSPPPPPEDNLVVSSIKKDLTFCLGLSCARLCYEDLPRDLDRLAPVLCRSAGWFSFYSPQVRLTSNSHVPAPKFDLSSSTCPSSARTLDDCSGFSTMFVNKSCINGAYLSCPLSSSASSDIPIKIQSLTPLAVCIDGDNCGKVCSGDTWNSYAGYYNARFACINSGIIPSSAATFVLRPSLSANSKYVMYDVRCHRPISEGIIDWTFGSCSYETSDLSVQPGGPTCAGSAPDVYIYCHGLSGNIGNNPVVTPSGDFLPAVFINPVVASNPALASILASPKGAKALFEPSVAPILASDSDAKALVNALIGPPPDPSRSSGFPAGAIAGIVISVVAIFAASIALGFFLTRKKALKRRYDTELDDDLIGKI